jgi:hypothetical protein
MYSYFTQGVTARGFHGRTPWGRLSCHSLTWQEITLMDLFHSCLITFLRFHLAQDKLSRTKVVASPTISYRHFHARLLIDIE